MVGRSVGGTLGVYAVGVHRYISMSMSINMSMFDMSCP